MKVKNTKRTIGLGFVGCWNDGTLGWCMPTHLSGLKGQCDHPEVNRWNVGERTYLCRITVEQVFNKRGRPTVRVLK